MRDQLRLFQMIGFTLLKMPHALNVAYEQSPIVQRSRDEFLGLRDTFKHIDPAAYRGIERCALSEIPQPEPGWIQDVPPNTLTTTDKRARRRLLEILGDHECIHYPCSLIPTLSLAKELMLLVDRPEEYEIVRLAHDASEETSVLGYDVGYWGGGNYSILCDSVIWPMWHRPFPEAFHHLVQHTIGLNRHVLFPDFESANRFRSFYVTQSWAEIEDPIGEFSVIRVDAVE
jgi:hypothetical protein